MRTSIRAGAITLFAAATLAVAGVALRADSPIADAAMRGDTAAVKALVGKGADVNLAQGDGMTALHWTALNGDVTTMNVLIGAGAKTSAVTRIGGFTPLHLAGERGQAGAVSRLLEAGADPRAATVTGGQPLHLAAQAGTPDAVRALLEKGADANAVDKTHGRTPLVFAVSQNRIEAMKVLIAKGARVAETTTVIDFVQRSSGDGADRVARDRAVAQATGRAVNRGLNLNDPPPTQVGQTGQAAGRGGAPPRAGGQGAGGGAARGPSDIQQIGRQGGFAAIHYAVRDGYPDAVNVLLAAGTDINLRTAGDQSSPMLVALINGQYDIALDLLKRGADPNLASDDGVAPLFATINNEWALRTWYPQPTAGSQQKASYLDVLEALLKGGADPNARTLSHIWYAAYNTGRMGVEFTGATPFWRAAYALDVTAMKLLVKYGADPNIPTMTYGSAARPNDPSGLPSVPRGGPHVPPFHAASGVGYGTSRVAQQHRTVPDGWMPAAKYFLEELKVDVNQRDADGFTALHHAAARGDNKMIMYLVSRDANVLVVNRAGQTTVDISNSPEQRTQPFPETIKLLEGMGAKNNNNCRACK